MAMNSCMSLFVPHAQLEATARWQIVVRMQVEGAEIMLRLVVLEGVEQMYFSWFSCMIFNSPSKSEISHFSHNN